MNTMLMPGAGVLLNPWGFKLGPPVTRRYLVWPLRKTYREFRLDELDPLTWAGNDGLLVQPSRQYWTDGGSVPLTLRCFFPADEFLGYYFHDSAYQSHPFHGLWFAQVSPDAVGNAINSLGPHAGDVLLRLVEKWEFREVTREWADTLLWRVILSEGCSAERAAVIYWSVRTLGTLGPRW